MTSDNMIPVGENRLYNKQNNCIYRIENGKLILELSLTCSESNGCMCGCCEVPEEPPACCCICGDECEKPCDECECCNECCKCDEDEEEEDEDCTKFPDEDEDSLRYRIKYFPLRYSNRYHADFGELILDPSGHIFIRNPNYRPDKEGDFDCDAVEDEKLFISPTFGLYEKMMEYVNTEMDDVREDMEELEFEFNIEDYYPEINSQIDQKLDPLKDKVTGIENDYSLIKNQMNDMNGKIDSIQDEIETNINSKLDDLTNYVEDELNNKFSDLNDKFTNKYNDLESKFNDYKENTDRVIANLEEKLDQMESQLPGPEEFNDVISMGSRRPTDTDKWLFDKDGKGVNIRLDSITLDKDDPSSQSSLFFEDPNADDKVEADINKLKIQSDEPDSEDTSFWYQVVENEEGTD